MCHKEKQDQEFGIKITPKNDMFQSKHLEGLRLHTPASRCHD